MAPLPSIEPGCRATIAGRTGSGKTTLAAWFLERSPQHWVIINPKHTRAYRELSDAVVYRKFDPRGISGDSRRRKFVVLELSGQEAEADYMDGIIGWLHGALHNVGLVCDELYTLHSVGGRAGSGLMGWLTRGREYRQSFLGLTQRPVFVSKFVWSEADLLIEMELNLQDDRDVLYQYTGNKYFLDKVTEHRWLCYDAKANSTVLYGRVPLNTQRSQAHG